MSELTHYGMPRKSGRYPWGSGENPFQSGYSFLAAVDKLKSEGLSNKEIADAFDISTGELVRRKAVAKNEKRKEDIAEAIRLKDRGHSNVAIGKKMGINESSVRNLLKAAEQDKQTVLDSTTNMLRDNVGEHGFIDIGSGTERWIGVSKEKLSAAVSKLVNDEGYTVHYLKTEQATNPGKFTSTKVLAPPDTKYRDVYQNRDKIHIVGSHTLDGGRTYKVFAQPKAISSDRIEVKYADNGGAEKDGIIEIRRGIKELSLGNSKYAQVRVLVDGDSYLKGVALYADDLPNGIDIRYNTSKQNKGDKKLAMKPTGSDPDNPFGAITKPGYYIDKDGTQHQTYLNIVNDEGTWEEWSRNLSSQMLSKQPVNLARKQLELAYRDKQADFEDIMALTNPAVRKRLLIPFSEDCDAAAVHLKAAKMPRQASHVILPIPGIKENEIYAPNYKNGEHVVLVRHPHGGTFEIPELKVNNKNAKAKSIIGQAKDAVGIHYKVAERLSGADFDGDTVLVIPNNRGEVKTSRPLDALKDFNPKISYQKYPGMTIMTESQKQREMGEISNLITDMTIRKANTNEIARAVKHSMVVIDAVNHELNYKQSFLDNGISELKNKYQKRPDGSGGGASTVVSQARSPKYVPERKQWNPFSPGSIDPDTGEKRYQETGATRQDGSLRETRSSKMAEAKDARSLSSGQPIEEVYANYANGLKALGNQARKAALGTPRVERSPSAAKVYAEEVSSLNAKLNVALKNSPLERKAQLVADVNVRAKRHANPDMEKKEIKKLKAIELDKARLRLGAKKISVDITDKEWEAIQAGAISDTALNKILENTDIERVKELATPRERPELSNIKKARIKAMHESGYTNAEIAEALGVSTGTISSTLKG